MEFMIKGTSALVSVPSQCVRQVAPLPEEQGGEDLDYSCHEACKPGRLCALGPSALDCPVGRREASVAAQPTHSGQGLRDVPCRLEKTYAKSGFPSDTRK